MLQKMNQIELSVGETWHKDYLTQESVTAIVQGARRWLFYKGWRKTFKVSVTQYFFQLESELQFVTVRNVVA